MIDDMTSSAEAPLTQEQAECLAPRTIEAIGFEVIERADVTAEEFVKADGLVELDIEAADGAEDEFVDAMLDCSLRSSKAFYPTAGLIQLASDAMRVGSTDLADQPPGVGAHSGSYALISRVRGRTRVVPLRAPPVFLPTRRATAHRVRGATPEDRANVS